MEVGLYGEINSFWKGQRLKVGCIVQARMGSTRLPGKVLKPVLDKPILWHIVNRLRNSKLIDEIIIATTNKDRDKPIIDMAQKCLIQSYAGSEEDLIDRFYQASKLFNLDIVVRIAADRPVIDPQIVDKVVEFFLEGEYDYAATVTREYPVSGSEYKLFPIGVRVQVYSIDAAERYKDYSEYINNKHKHPCSYIFEHPESFNIGYLEAKDKWCFLNHPNLNFAVNYQENFEMVRQIFENCYFENSNFSMNDIMQTVDLNQDLKLLMGNKPIINNEI